MSIALIAAAMLSASAAQPTLEVLAHTGSPAPDLPGGTLHQFSPSRVGNGGHVLFYAEVQGAAYASRPGAWFFGPPAEPRLLTRINAVQAPGLPAGARITSVSSPVFDEDGALAFIAGRSDSGEAVYVVHDQTFTVVAASGDPAPGVAGSTIADIRSVFMLNGVVLIGATTTTGGASQPYAVFIRRSQSLSLLTRDGAAAPALGAGAVVREPEAHGLTTSGDAIVSFRLSGSGINAGNDYAVCAMSEQGSTEVLLRKGQPAPGFPAGAVVSHIGINTISCDNFGELVLNMQATGGGVTDATRSAIIRANTIVARAGEPAPGLPAGVLLAAPGSPLVARGCTAWQTSLSGAGVTAATNSACYLNGDLKMREGAPAADAPAGAAYVSGGSGLLEPIAAANDFGDWAARAQILGGGISPIQYVLYVGEAGGPPAALVRPGFVLPFDDSQSKIATGFRHATGCNEGGRGGPLSDSRELLLTVFFEDLTQSLIIARFGPAGPSCDPDVNCDGVPDQSDIACLILAVAGDLGCFCQPDPDFNADGVPDQGDIADLIIAVAGGPCP